MLNRMTNRIFGKKLIKFALVMAIAFAATSVISSCAGATGGSGCAATQGFNL